MLKKTVQLAPLREKKIRGLGDVVYYAARPIVAASDALLGTDLKNCMPCKSRRETLNQKMPL
jgi:hypothetical protein